MLVYLLYYVYSDVLYRYGHRKIVNLMEQHGSTPFDCVMVQAEFVMCSFVL